MQPMQPRRGVWRVDGWTVDIRKDGYIYVNVVSDADTARGFHIGGAFIGTNLFIAQPHLPTRHTTPKPPTAQDIHVSTQVSNTFQCIPTMFQNTIQYSANTHPFSLLPLFLFGQLPLLLVASTSSGGGGGSGPPKVVHVLHPGVGIDGHRPPGRGRRRAVAAGVRRRRRRRRGCSGSG